MPDRDGFTRRGWIDQRLFAFLSLCAVVARQHRLILDRSRGRFVPTRRFGLFSCLSPKEVHQFRVNLIRMRPCDAMRPTLHYRKMSTWYQLGCPIS